MIINMINSLYLFCLREIVFEDSETAEVERHLHPNHWRRECDIFRVERGSQSRYWEWRRGDM